VNGKSSNNARSRTPLKRREASVISPLRYPGAKRRLAGYVSETIRLNSLRPKVFVEPFAGGASVSLQLLNDGVVESIVLGERDSLIASFWKVLFRDTDWLVEQIESIEVSVENWCYFRENSFRSNRDRALACLFLNRTSFSGILAKTAGPIGGRNQTSKYKIDCRFNVSTLKKRILQIAALKDRVLLVNHGDWEDTISQVESWSYGGSEVLYYLDPPFYDKAARLYRHFFSRDDHNKLHDRLVRLDQPWLLSYDPAPSIQTLYSHNGQGPKRVDLLYSASGTGSLIEAQELIVTNLARLPHATRIWRTSEEWRSTRKNSGLNGRKDRKRYASE
jgi:DNA adenine methylase